MIYKVFSNSVTGSFAWIGAEEAKIIYLNDFWWHPEMVLVKGGAIDRVNAEMMNCQWFFSHFWKQIPHADQEDIPLCRFCFAKFILHDVCGWCHPSLPCVTKTCKLKENCCHSSHVQFSE